MPAAHASWAVTAATSAVCLRTTTAASAIREAANAPTRRPVTCAAHPVPRTSVAANAARRCASAAPRGGRPAAVATAVFAALVALVTLIVALVALVVLVSLVLVGSVGGRHRLPMEVGPQCQLHADKSSARLRGRRHSGRRHHRHGRGVEGRPPEHHVHTPMSATSPLSQPPSPRRHARAHLQQGSGRHRGAVDQVEHLPQRGQDERVH